MHEFTDGVLLNTNPGIVLGM